MILAAALTLAGLTGISVGSLRSDSGPYRRSHVVTLHTLAAVNIALILSLVVVYSMMYGLH